MWQLPLATLTSFLLLIAAISSTVVSATLPDRYSEDAGFLKQPIVMLPIEAGEFVMGSPNDEANREGDEGPQVAVKLNGFWMGRNEVTWSQFRPFLEADPAKVAKLKSNYDIVAGDHKEVDAISRPTPISWHVNVLNIGTEDNKPVAGITQYSAKMYCRWLSAKSGHFYRLPTEAEWEFACRAGTTTAYSFGNDPEQLSEYAWFDTNAYDVDVEGYRPVGKKKPNRWGLYDMHGNVAEWVLDGYDKRAYSRLTADNKDNPFIQATALYPRVVRGGSWIDSREKLRSAARTASDASWKEPDPEFPKSKWYHRSGEFVGFRIIRPFAEPNEAQRKRSAIDEHQR